jgi:hypothetical protein
MATVHRPIFFPQKVAYLATALRVLRVPGWTVGAGRNTYAPSVFQVITGGLPGRALRALRAAADAPLGGFRTTIGPCRST